MLTSCFVLVALLALGAAATATPPTRRLLAPAALQTAKQCMWVAESKSCEAGDPTDIMYAARSKPASPYLWFLMMTQDHKNACDSYQSKDSCRGDTVNNCVWLDDVLGKTSSSSSSSSSKAKPGRKAAERSSDAVLGSAAGVPNLFTARMAAVQQEFGLSLRDMLGRVDSPLQQAAMEILAGGAGDAGAGAASKPAAAAPAPAASSKKPAASSAAASKDKEAPLIKCTSKNLLDNLVFTRSGYKSVLQAPLAMHCPNSPAYNLIKCMGQTSNAACAATPGCVVVPRMSTKSNTDLCVSQHFNKLTKEQMNKFMYALTLGESSVVGNCDGACWIRQALLCNHTVGEEGCAALSFCRTLGGSCVPKLYTEDAFGSTVQEYLGECSEVDNKKACESYTIKLVNKGKYRGWSMPARAAGKCLVPSVKGILGRGSTVAKEAAARTEMLTMIGAETEKQAAALAAATAAADATKAGKIMLERGATGLQQLYARASTVILGP